MSNSSNFLELILRGGASLPVLKVFHLHPLIPQFSLPLFSSPSLSLLLPPLSSPHPTLPLAVTSSTVQPANIKSIMPPQMVSYQTHTHTHTHTHWSHLVVLVVGCTPLYGVLTTPGQTGCQHQTFHCDHIREWNLSTDSVALMCSPPNTPGMLLL